MSETNSHNFNHLKIHSQYSICEGAVKIDDLNELSKKINLNQSVCVTLQIYVVHLNLLKSYQNLVPNQ